MISHDALRLSDKGALVHGRTPPPGSNRDPPSDLETTPPPWPTPPTGLFWDSRFGRKIEGLPMDSGAAYRSEHESSEMSCFSA
jgi:hypothetical protein